MNYTLHQGDCLDVLKTMADCSIDSIVTDPPYGLSQHSQADIRRCLTQWLNGERYHHDKPGFLGKAWDAFPPGPEIWAEYLAIARARIEHATKGNLDLFAHGMAEVQP